MTSCPSAPAPRRERTWLHRVTIAVDAIADAATARSPATTTRSGSSPRLHSANPKHAGPVIDLRNEQQALRVAIASLREQLDDHPELPIDTSGIRERFNELAHRYRRHPTRETELIHTALGIDITQPIDQQPR